MLCRARFHVEAIEFYTEGRSLLRADKFADALIPLKAAYETDSTCIEALAAIAECYFELGDFITAERYALIGVKGKPNYPDSYKVLIDLHVSQVGAKVTEAHLRVVVTQQPEVRFAHLNVVFGPHSQPPEDPTSVPAVLLLNSLFVRRLFRRSVESADGILL